MPKCFHLLALLVDNVSSYVCFSAFPPNILQWTYGALIIRIVHVSLKNVNTHPCLKIRFNSSLFFCRWELFGVIIWQVRIECFQIYGPLLIISLRSTLTMLFHNGHIFIVCRISSKDWGQWRIPFLFCMSWESSSSNRWMLRRHQPFNLISCLWVNTYVP